MSHTIEIKQVLSFCNITPAAGAIVRCLLLLGENSELVVISILETTELSGISR
ncbi:hypothetical protein [Endozoicomonas sp. Mp262]|uniref:hypothetical protein n=1 Tax=Endozoicomonas sp. Mp262 TaxID=2919499 RepID=UPI0021D81978